ncbi:uncharacterized protein N7473_000036 [Penicillium subrubescens]|uniref:uncharacterized protein n=1 Tax=Penicillium subrubescens TaxID=1316194 RepID=UPI00254550EF|nr:uncharacterized protein N7473_000036 [Penicillium subrubescens]KAJ5910733.1 hypothetical protein N7473_000036 [Penicillium subrubescens]
MAGACQQQSSILLLVATDGLVILGRVMAGVIFLTTPVKPEQLLGFSTIGASVTWIVSIVLNTKSFLAPFYLNYIFLAAIFPTIFGMALRCQGGRIHLCSASQISLMVGGAIFPAVQDGIENATSIQKSLILPAALFYSALILPLFTLWDPVRSVLRRGSSMRPSRMGILVQSSDEEVIRHPDIRVEHAVIIENQLA